MTADQFLSRSEFTARAKTLIQEFSDLEVQAIAILVRYTDDYHKAGLSTAWNDVPSNTVDMDWKLYPDEPGLCFSGTDRDGDFISTTVPWEYIADPEGYIAALARTRAEQRTADERRARALAQRTRDLRITELRAELRELEAELS